MSSMPRKHSCGTCKEHLFCDKNTDGFKSRLKENVIYHRSYTLRPTVKVNAIPICITNKKSLSKTDSSIKQESILNNRTSAKTKPVIEEKPKAINTKQVFESDIRSRSASLPVIPSQLKLNFDGSKPTADMNSTKSSAEQSSSAVMNQIRRRVSQIIDSHLLSDIQTAQPVNGIHSLSKSMERKPVSRRSIDRRQSSDTPSIKIKEKSRSFDHSSDRRRSIDTNENQRESKRKLAKNLENSENLYNQFVNRRENTEIKMKSCEDNNKSINRRLIEYTDRDRGTNFKTDETLINNKTRNDLMLRNYYIDSSRNSLSLIQNCYRD